MLSITFNYISNLFTAVWTVTKKHGKKISFWIWVIFFFLLYKFTPIFIFFLITIVVKIIKAFIIKKMIITFKFTDIIALLYITSIKNTNKNKFLYAFVMVLINTALTFSVGIFKIWIDFYDLAHHVWSYKKMKNKKIKTYPNFVKDCILKYKEKYVVNIDTSVETIFNIHITYNF